MNDNFDLTPLRKLPEFDSLNGGAGDDTMNSSNDEDTLDGGEGNQALPIACGMKTDKQYYKIFEVKPEWAYLLAGLKPPGRVQFRSVAIKELEGIADGVLIPADVAEPLTVMELQEQENAEIYATMAIKMASLQKMHDMRAVRGVIFFGDKRLDPNTEPWNQVIQSFVLRDAVVAFAEQHPNHPLAAVFDPLLARDDDEFKRRAVGDLRQIKYSGELSRKARDVLLDVFASWVHQRFKHLPRKEIEIMMLSELPSLEETRAGKELIELGEARGEARGLAEAVLLLMAERFGRISEPSRKQILALPKSTVQALLKVADDITSLESLKQWLARHPLLKQRPEKRE
ncbi:MAG: DUF2887 domain-containing protein [Planctomycetaceae bacterium]